LSDANLLYDLWHKVSSHQDPQGELFLFDCDKTLITGDIGEASFRRALRQRWTISHDAWWRHLDAAEIATADERAHWRRAYENEAKISDRIITDDQSDSLSDDLWRAYETLCELDVYLVYIYVARFAYQRTQDEISELTRAAFSEDSTTQVRDMMYDFVNHLQSRGGHIWVVSSSHIESVRVIAEHYHIPKSQVIGIDFIRHESTTHCSDHLVTPVPINTGKVDAFFARHLEQPALMMGDSFYDLPLMAAAQHRFLIDHHQSSDLSVAAKALGAELIDHAQIERYTLH
jgi:phosphoserine phosphatase